MIELFNDEKKLIATKTNAEGRCDSPLLADKTMVTGEVEIHFHIGSYFRDRDIETPFLDIVPVRFSIEADSDYHVPLVCSPWSYSTYRGS